MAVAEDYGFEMNVSLIFILVNLICVACLPATVQPGLFYISGVTTCGQGTGYCLLDDDCTTNEHLEPDLEGHCNELRGAFTSEFDFSCCRYVAKNSTLDLNDVPTAVLNSTETQTSDSIDVLHRVNDVDDHTENEMGISDEQVVSTSDVNDLCCAPETTSVNVDDQIPVTKDAINFRSANLDGEAEEAEELPSSDPVQEFFKIHRALFGDHVKNERNCTKHDYASLFPLLSSNSLSSSELRGSAIKEKFDKNKCLNLTNQFEGNSADDEGCINIWKFVSQNELLCVGTLINSVWLLTSAACVTKVFDAGMDSIIVTDIEEKSGYYGISNIIVHENYMIDGISDMHDVGLVSLNQIVKTSCFGCLPVDEKKYADKSCVTYTINGNRKQREFLGKCQDRLKILNMNSKMYLSLPCLSNEEHPLSTEDYTANALWCENKLVGIETSYDQGYFVFTPINEYVDWIRRNVQLYL